MTDRGQLDLISLLVNLFLSPLLVHHSYTFYPFLPPPPFALFISCPLLFFAFSAFSSLAPSLLSLSSASLTSFTLSRPPLPLFLSFLLLLSPSCSPRVNHSFIFFGRTLSYMSSTHHPGPFIIPLSFFSHFLDKFLSAFNFIIPRFAKTSLTWLSLSRSILYFVCACVCLSLTTRLAGRAALCMC